MALIKAEQSYKVKYLKYRNQIYIFFLFVMSIYYLKLLIK